MAQKVPSVVTDLYRISNKLNPQAPAGEAQGTTPEAMLETIVAEEKKGSFLDEVASAHLKRRYGDFQRSRNDLLERLSTMESRLAAEEMELDARLNIVRSTKQEIAQLLEAVPAHDPAKEAFSDRGELTDLTLKIEKQRIEMMRMMPIVDGASEKMRSMDGAPGAGKSKAETGVILDSLGFRQVLRLAFALNLPILLAILIAAAIIAVAVIGSFKGMF